MSGSTPADPANPNPGAPPAAAPPRSLAERAVEALGGVGVIGNTGAARPPAPLPEAQGPTPSGAAPAAIGSAVGAAGATDTLARPPAPIPAPTPTPTPPGATAPPRPATITREQLIAAHAFSLEASRSRCAEEFAVIQQQVLRAIPTGAAAEGRLARTVMITSARPAEGKSFTALNLALMMARAGSAPALLVDGDGKKDCIGMMLGLGAAPGLRDLAAEPARTVAPLMHGTFQPGLLFLPYGAVPSSEAPAPPGAALAGALKRVAAAFPNHVIIIDTPPTLSVNEASSLASVVGQTLLVVQAETTQRSEVEAALDMLDACPTLQLVLNRARVSTSASFGAYGYETYGAYGKN